MQKNGKSMVAVSCLGGISSNFNYYGVTDEEVKNKFFKWTKIGIALYYKTLYLYFISNVFLSFKFPAKYSKYLYVV
jgi:hypothetical protein